MSVARPAQFDETQVLQAAMQAFWSTGYTATSMADLRAVTGLNPGSIYNRYGSKKGLFLEALAFYIDAIVGERIDTMGNDENPIAGIEMFFLSAFDSVPAQDLIGCLLTNTSADKEGDDQQISALVQAGLTRIEDAIRERLTQAQQAGQISKDIEADATALHLLSCFQGLMVMSRATKDKKRLRILTQQALSVLG